MRQSQLFGRTSKTSPKDEVSLNAELLIKAGFVDKLTSGVYTYLPLGLRVLQKVQNIIRKEMNSLDAQEILMPALSPKENWQLTGRWDNFDALFKLKGAGDKDYALGATHEEIVTPLAKRFIQSYKDLPLAIYQIQDKFRNEPRAKSGILRGREFNMKDLYSFHADEKSLDVYYDKVKDAYLRIFEQCGLSAKIVEASGGTFSKLSHEFQVFTDAGEDTVRYCAKEHWAQNVEICELPVGGNCPVCNGKILEAKAIEVGNIFKLYSKYSAPFDLKFTDETGAQRDVLMGCYGIGPSRIVGTVVEANHDDKGIVWPESLAPFSLHLIILGNDDEVKMSGDKLYNELAEAGIEVLYDDRDLSAGAKFNDADLIGLPHRAVISAKTLAKNKIEYKSRQSEEVQLIDSPKLITLIGRK